MIRHCLDEPEFLEEGDFFVVKFNGPGENILDLPINIPEEGIIDLKGLGLNNRQIKALEIMINQKKALTNSMYQKEFEVSSYTASRDLKGLVEKDQAFKIGKGYSTKYKATINDAA